MIDTTPSQYKSKVQSPCTWVPVHDCHGGLTEAVLLAQILHRLMFSAYLESFMFLNRNEHALVFKFGMCCVGVCHVGALAPCGWQWCRSMEPLVAAADSVI